MKKQLPTTLVKSLHVIILTLPLAKRQELRPQIEELQLSFNDKTNLFVDQRGKHWAELKVQMQIRGQGSTELTYAEATKYINRTKKQLQTALSLGRGRASFTVGDEVITLLRLST